MFVAMILSTALALCGCGSDSDDGGDPGEGEGTGGSCSASDVDVCDGSSAYKTCDNGEWKTVECDSDKICQGGKCVDSASGGNQEELAGDVDKLIDEYCKKYNECMPFFDLTAQCKAGFSNNNSCLADTKTYLECAVKLDCNKMMAGQDEPAYCTDEYKKVQSCTGNSSSGNEDECKSTDKDVCDGSSAYKTCDGGKWKSVSCKSGQVCEGGKCVDGGNQPQDECKSTDKDVCDGSSAYKTCDGGKWKSVSCKSGQVCEGGKCVDDSEGTCAEGDTKCVGNASHPTSVMKCEGGSWKLTECKQNYYCSGGECVPENACTGNDSVCTGLAKYQICNDGSLEEGSCKSGEYCSNGKCEASYTDSEYAEIVDAVCENAESCAGANSDFACSDATWNIYSTAIAISALDKSECVTKTTAMKTDRTYGKCANLYADLLSCRAESACNDLKICKKDGVYGTESDKCYLEISAFNDCVMGKLK